MNKKKLSFILFMFALFLQAATVSSQSLQTVPKIGLGVNLWQFNGIDLAVEIPVAEKITIEPAVGFGPRGWISNLMEPSLHLSMHGKFIYNRNKLKSEGKSLLFNSGNFIGVKVRYVFKPINAVHSPEDAIFTTVNWGGQRNIGQHWNYSYLAGAGFSRNMDTEVIAFHPSIELKVSYVLPWL